MHKVDWSPFRPMTVIDSGRYFGAEQQLIIISCNIDESIRMIQRMGSLMMFPHSMESRVRIDVVSRISFHASVVLDEPAWMIPVNLHDAFIINGLAYQICSFEQNYDMRNNWPQGSLDIVRVPNLDTILDQAFQDEHMLGKTPKEYADLLEKEERDGTSSWGSPIEAEINVGYIKEGDDPSTSSRTP